MDVEKKEQVLTFDDSHHLDKTLTSLNTLRKNKQFCDVILQVGASQDVREIHAHRAVLASASPYFFELFTAENKGRQVFQYKLNGNFDLDSIERLVEYAYTAKLEVPKSQVKAVYLAANRLRMFSAAKQCGNYLADNLTPKNCIGVRSILGMISDPERLLKVDNYIRQKIDEVAKSKELLALPTVQVELLQNTTEEREATNGKHLCDMVLDWVKRATDESTSSLAELPEKVHMLYLNPDHTLHDCNDIENGDMQDSEVIQDYKKLSRRISFPNSSRNSKKSSHNTPAKPRQFLYTKSDSSSSLSSLSDDEEKDWKVIATLVPGEHSIMGLVVASSKLFVLSVVQRLHTPSHSPLASRNTSVEKANTYSIIPTMSSQRCAAGTAEFNGKLLVCGGYDRVECLKTVELYDIGNNKWIPIKPMKASRGRFGITVVDGNIFAIGGSDGTKELQTAEYYDSEANSWKSIPNLSAVRSYTGVCNLDGKIYVIGGWNGQRGLTRCDVFDPKTTSWSSIAPLQVGRYQVGAVAMNNCIYAAGGCDSWNCLNSVEKYDPITNTWTTVTSLPTARRGCGLAVYNGKMYAVGGHDGVRSLCSVEVFDPQTNTWSSGPSLTSCRANVGVAVVDNRLFAVGGFNGKVFLNTIEFLDPQTNEWTTFVSKDSNIESTNCEPPPAH